MDKCKNIKEPILFDRQKYFDDRGSFEKIFDVGICRNIDVQNFNIKQINKSFNKWKGTVRGLHFQKGNYAEQKILSVIKGSLDDYIVDVRVGSATFGRVWKFRIGDDKCQSLLVPRGFAHGFQTLEDNTEILYLHDNEYDEENECGINILDPNLNIEFSLPIQIISKRDSAFLKLNEVNLNV